MKTEQEIQSIIELYNNGQSSNKLSKIFNVSSVTVLNILKRNNVKRRLSYSIVIPPNQENEIINLYNSGESSVKIAAKFNISSTAVLNFLKKKNINRRSPNRDYMFDEKFLDDINTSDKAYIIGLFLAGGSVKKNSLCISVVESDMEILIKIKNIFKTDKPIYVRQKIKNTHNNIVALELSSSHMIKSIKKFGIIENKTFKVKFPKDINCLFYSDFIRGYFDGHGSISFDEKKKNFRVAINGTSDFCAMLKDIILQELNINISVLNCKNDKLKICTLGGNIKVKKFLDFIYKDANFYIVRKRNTYIRGLEYMKKFPKKENSEESHKRALENYDAFKIYSMAIRNLTQKHKKMLFKEWDGLDYYDGQNIKNNSKLHHTHECYPTVDHKISIYFGFVNNISIEEIGNINNLCITKRKINGSKHIKNYNNL